MKMNKKVMKIPNDGKDYTLPFASICLIGCIILGLMQ